MMNTKLSVLFKLLIAKSLLCGGVFAQAPNLVFVFPDQMRGEAMGFLGKEKVFTPNLDQFASESIVFTEAVCNYPVCSPTRAMILTGQYPHANGVISNCTSKSGEYGIELKQDAQCWSDVLKAKGYSLGYIGKWHLDTPLEPYINTYNNKGEVKWNEWCPPERRHGFDYWHAYGTYDNHLNPMYWDTKATREEYEYVDKWGPEHEADKAVAFITNKNGEYRDGSKPFALVVSMNPPHTGYNLVPQKYKDVYKEVDVESLVTKPNIPEKGSKWGDHYRKHIKDYYAAITGVDEQFGRIVEALKAEGINQNTIVVFTSDHGDCIGTHGMITKNNYYEESMKVPMIIRYPAKIKARRDDLLISTPDLYPTLMHLMDLQDAIPASVEGANYGDYLISKKGAIPSSQLYMKIPMDNSGGGTRGVRTDRYTYVVEKKEANALKVVLFDRLKDPYQLNNLAGTNPELENKLRQQLQSWLNRNNDPWIMPDL
jgi:arylsulfatase A-like enzyme